MQSNKDLTNNPPTFFNLLLNLEAILGNTGSYRAQGQAQS